MTSRICSILITFFLAPLLAYSQTSSADTSPRVYHSEALQITRLTEKVYIHTSYFNSESFGKVDCNGMIVANQNEVIIFDTPIDDKSSAELINWIQQELNHTIKAVIATHFHDDCVGGLKEFHKHNIPSYANNKTIELAKAHQFNVPTNGFKESLTLPIGKEKVYLKFFGEGHTKDNIVGYFPSAGALFGGCLIKSLNASKGNLADANVDAWPNTVEKVKKEYPNVKLVVPGHGPYGDKALLDYTIQLFINK